MAASLSAATAAAPVIRGGHSGGDTSVRAPRVVFRVPAKPKLLLFASKGSRYSRNQFAVPRAQVNEVILDGSSNATPIPDEKKVDLKPEPSSLSVQDGSISEFMAQVSSLVKLVDSRDIVELQLKQNDCELIIRKKEALPQPAASAPVVMMQPPAPTMPPQYAPPLPSASPAPRPAPALPAPAAPKPSSSSLPTIKCPMAGTFYKCPGPGEPPFVKVGDQVKKGQVLCIIEAMKLMNEIEADQSGKIVEILAEDGKPVSVDMPLFVIEP